VYMVLFGWIIVAAFKMGMIFQNAPAMTANTTLNLSVITPSAANGTKPKDKPQALDEPEHQETGSGRR